MSSRAYWLQGTGVWLTSIAAVAAVIVLWWLLARFVVASDVLLPTPGAVGRRFDQLLTAPNGSLQLLPNVWASLRRILLGLGTGVAAGTVLGTAMASNRWISAIIDPLVQLGRPIPPLAFAPLFIVWFGIGETPKVLILFFAVVPIMIIATAASIGGVDESLRRAALSLGASRLYLIRKVILPAALPEILTAIRISSGICWSTLVAAEIIASTAGLGWMILNAGRFLDTDAIFVGIIAIGALALIMDRALLLLQRRLVPWRGMS